MPLRTPEHLIPQRFRGIRFKLTLVLVGLVALTTFGAALLVTAIMDRVLLDSLLDRGSAISRAASVPAGYSLLTGDRLALDNLAAQIKADQNDITHVAIVDLEQTIVAHDRLPLVGTRFTPLPGEHLDRDATLSTARARLDDATVYEFVRPILFSDQVVGSVALGISDRSLIAATLQARRTIDLAAGSVTLLALLAILLFTRHITRPIERLSQGVSGLQAGDQIEEIPVRSRDELGLLTLRFNRMARIIQRQKSNLIASAGELEASYNDIVRILAAALDARDNYTYGHSARVARLALALAERIGLPPEEIKELELACLLHDVGKIHVPDAILNKRDRLDPAEQQQIGRHPLHGTEILSLAPSLHKYIPAVKHHHERYDGSGYPDRLQGDAIPLQAQIVALADTYDAMTSSRPYRSGRSRAEAIAELRACSGSQFNPHLVEPFIAILAQFPESMANDILRTEYLCAG